MFSVLGDVYAISPDGESFQVYEEFPVRVIHQFAELTRCNHTRIIVQLMEYGKDFSYPGADVFRPGEITIVILVSVTSFYACPLSIETCRVTLWSKMGKNHSLSQELRSERSERASDQVNRRASGPVLTSGFLAILAHSEWASVFMELYGATFLFQVGRLAIPRRLTSPTFFIPSSIITPSFLLTAPVSHAAVVLIRCDYASL